VLVLKKMDIIGTVEYFPTPQKKKLENNVTTKSVKEKKNKRKSRATDTKHV